MSAMNDEGSAETVKAELAIFDPLPYQVSHVKADWIRQEPENVCYGTNTATPLIFKIDKSPGLYLDFSDSFVDCVVAIEGIDSAVADTQNVAFVNFVLHTLFRDVSFSINNTKIEGENMQYHLKSYIYALLNSSQNAKQHQLASSGWEHDTAANFDTVTNKGYIARKEWTLKGRDLYLCGPLYLDTWMQEQYFTDQCGVTLKFTRNSPDLCLQNFCATKPAPNYKINIKRMRLWIRKVQVAPSVIAGHQAGLARMNARWNYNSHKIFTYFYNTGTNNIAITDSCPGIYPKLILAMMTSTAAYNGDSKLSPYNFKHNSVRSIGLSINGQFTPAEPFTPDFATEDVRREYISLFLGTGHAGLNEDQNGILMADFVGGNTIFAFNLSPDLFLSGHGEPARLSNIAIDIKFTTALTEPTTLILMCRYDTKIEMTQLGNIVLDPTQSAN